MSKKLILNTNPVVIIQEFERAVLQGYFFVPGRSDLFVHASGLMEMELYKQELSVQKIEFEDALDIVTIHNHDKTVFMLEIQKYVLSGWCVDLNTLYYDVVGSKMCRMKHPEHPVSLVYTKEELQAMEYEELKRVAKLRNAFNKSRDVMVTKVLQFQEARK